MSKNYQVQIVNEDGQVLLQDSWGPYDPKRVVKFSSPTIARLYMKEKGIKANVRTHQDS